jgi:hypothetical protein
MPRKPAPSFTVKLVGVTFQTDYPDNLFDLEELVDWAEARNRTIPLQLYRAPTNVYDANAIEVHHHKIGMLGHLPKHLAERVAPEIDNGTKWSAYAEQVVISGEAPDQPGLKVRCKREKP